MLLLAILLAAALTSAPETAAGPSIDSILDGLSGGTTDEDEAAPSPPPVTTDTPDVYDARVRSVADRVEATQGLLDGGWRLEAQGGEALYRFQISDRGFGGPAEGVWRDVRVKAFTDGAGIIDYVGVNAGELMVRFNQSDPADLVVVTARPAGASWSGDLWRKGAVTKVVLKKR